MYAILSILLSIPALAGLQVSTQKLEFGDIYLNSWKSDSFTVTNPYDKKIRLYYYDNCPSSFSVSFLCSDSMEPGSSCTVDVDFAPRIPGRVRCEAWFETSEGDHITVIIRGMGVRW